MPGFRAEFAREGMGLTGRTDRASSVAPPRALSIPPRLYRIARLADEIDGDVLFAEEDDAGGSSSRSEEAGPSVDDGTGRESMARSALYAHPTTSGSSRS